MSDHIRPAHIGTVVLGPGMPAVIVPLLGSTREALIDEIAALDYDDLDLVELRIDHFDAVDDLDEVQGAIETVRDELRHGVPILFTFRSKPEGGHRDIDAGSYEALLSLASGLVEAVDVEMFTELGSLERIVNGAHAAGASVVMSSHEFERTPTIEQILARLSLQQDLGADVVKIAVMPKTPSDVLTLMQATTEFATTKAVRPAITMAMGPLGVVSRLAGEVFGSSATFGSVSAASAPGQLAARDVRRALVAVHSAQG
ncbi:MULTISPECIES: type I 3-dehydroquinate dehydratase [unclassified Frondihabitans]|uniref:type I 3-dehydroquinate dehydratase n=1 Tax=unclassified Frondihabitans TaxID=2626248 RepID=UPI000F4FDA33|nr:MULTISPECIES: type I 3-dehydroquinate dehydratase [unclassified Frondihabitans]RPE78713.1 3-dehydroquinate dehydratase [Frondihabitans sp. PhB153]RPF08994.1 3-dehydroquinate dehydratase [Frondihabitans sp. PhB161]